MGFINDLFGASTGSSKPILGNNDYAPFVQQGLNTQSGLSTLLSNMANGTGGPNLAQTQLQNAQNQNAQQAAGMAASQKGINPQVAAQNILRNYGMANQNAANQSAQLAQQQQLGAIGQLGNVANQQVGAGQIQNQQNNSQLQNAQFNAQQNAATAGGVMNAIGSGAQMVSQLLADGGEVQPSGINFGALFGNGQPQGGQGLNGSGMPGQFGNPMLGGGNNGQSPASVFGGSTGGVGGGIQPTGINIGAAFGNSGQGKSGGGGGGGGGAGLLALLSEGGKVPGKAKVDGDSLQNDVVDAKLSPGEIVIPKSVVEGRPEDAAAFVQAVKAHKEKQEMAPEGYSKVLQSHRQLHDRVSALEKHMKKGKK